MNSKLNSSDSLIHEKALALSAQYKKVEADLINILQNIDGRKIYLRLGYSSLFDYSVKALGLSESVAYNFITVARKSKEVPALQVAIVEGKISVSKARKITPVINQENQSRWLELAQTATQKELEKEVAKVLPQPEPQVQAKYIQEDRLKLSLGISEDVYNLLKRVQDLESSRLKKSISFEEALKSALEIYIQKLDPLERAKRQESKILTDQPVARQVLRHGAAPIPFQRNYIPANLKHQVMLRDQGRCAHKDSDGKNCGNTRWLETHHVIPISHGGQNEINNLITLCNGHHKMKHTS